MYKPVTFVMIFEVAAKALISEEISGTVAAKDCVAAVIMDPDPMPQAIARA